MTVEAASPFCYLLEQKITFVWSEQAKSGPYYQEPTRGMSRPKLRWRRFG